MSLSKDVDRGANWSYEETITLINIWSDINICFKNRNRLLKIGIGNTQKPSEAQGQTTPAMPMWIGCWIYSALPSSGANKSGAVAPLLRRHQNRVLNYRLYRFPASDLFYYWAILPFWLGTSQYFHQRCLPGEVQPHWSKIGHPHILSMGKFGHTRVVNWWLLQGESKSVGFMITVSSL